MTPIEARARCEALGITTEDAITALLHLDEFDVAAWRSGGEVSAAAEAALERAEHRCERLVALAVAHIEAERAAERPGVTLLAWDSDAALWAAQPDLDGTPAALHRVAMSRARAHTTSASFPVRITTPIP